jgi:hypothetical protein
MRRACLVACLAVAAIAAVPATSASAATFDGTCKIRATVHVDPPINALPQNISWWIDDGGSPDDFSVEGSSGQALWRDSTCTGQLDGAAYDGPVSLASSGYGLQACDEGLLSGTGTLTFDATGRGAHHAGAKKAGFRISAPYLVRFPAFYIEGTGGGKATGTTQFWTTKSPAGFTNCVAEGQLTPDTRYTHPANGVSDAMFEALIVTQPGGVSG